MDPFSTPVIIAMVLVAITMIFTRTMTGGTEELHVTASTTVGEVLRGRSAMQVMFGGQSIAAPLKTVMPPRRPGFETVVWHDPRFDNDHDLAMKTMYLQPEELSPNQRTAFVAEKAQAAAEHALAMSRSMAYHKILEGSTLHLVLPRGDIGVFVERGELDWQGVPVASAPGVELLTIPLPAAPALPPVPVAAAALAAAVLAPTGRQPSSSVHVGSAPLLPAAACQQLVELVEAAWARGGEGGGKGEAEADAGPGAGAVTTSTAAAIAAGCTRTDFKLLLSAATARGVLGEQGLAGLLAALEEVRGGGGGTTTATTSKEGPPPLQLPPLTPPCLTLALRRTEALPGSAPRWVNFHADTAGATAQVPLNSAAQGVVGGGVTVYALGSGQLLQPGRAAGRVVAHHGDVAHGVTALLQGVRYGLFALVEREQV